MNGPEGTKRSKIYYFDAEGRAVEKQEDAVQARIRVLDDLDNLLEEVWMTKDPRASHDGEKLDIRPLPPLDDVGIDAEQFAEELLRVGFDEPDELRKIRNE